MLRTSSSSFPTNNAVAANLPLRLRRKFENGLFDISPLLKGANDSRLAFTNRLPKSFPPFSLQPPTNGSDFSSSLNTHVGVLHEIYAESAIPVDLEYPASAPSPDQEASEDIFGPSVSTQHHVFISSTSPTRAPYPSPSPSSPSSYSSSSFSSFSSSSSSSAGAGADHLDVTQSPDPNPPSSSSVTTATETSVMTNSDYLRIPFTDIQKIYAPPNGKTEQCHRELALNADPWVATYTKTSARCRGCGKTLQLEKRGTRYYYPANWIKHRDQGPCSQIKEGIFTEEKTHGS
ncbi:hypothetical protein K435DRAFT_966348 [Dendrothele bispora CBS 962.96]|uniref:Uncharacterized protein n=1 Tax=Dendrothele bispora (strain CBS 962.96) TaxID=1314807 RepID=A0A4S8M1R9_DENBC|nr:hypothetical protein K435DRAFT_966348 [Dendrothele bispora CBS 962.96]